MGRPAVDEKSWRLQFGGPVGHSASIGIEDLRKLPFVEATSVMERAGGLLKPTSEVRRVANATWGGVCLADVLELAGGVTGGASFVWSFGLITRSLQAFRTLLPQRFRSRIH